MPAYALRTRPRSVFRSPGSCELSSTSFIRLRYAKGMAPLLVSLLKVTPFHWATLIDAESYFSACSCNCFCTPGVTSTWKLLSTSVVLTTGTQFCPTGIT